MPDYEVDGFVDCVAQAVVDRLEQRRYNDSLVEMVVHRVVELRRLQAALAPPPRSVAPMNSTLEDHDVRS